MDEQGNKKPKDAEEFVAQETGDELSNPENIDSEKPEEPSEESSDQSAEFQLTPEIEEKVMEKVQDIDKYGTAFSSLSFQSSKDERETAGRLKDTLKTGLLGTSGNGGEEKNLDQRVQEWKQNARSWNIPVSQVWFNIVGRMSGISGEHQIKKSYMISINGAAIIFDLSDFQELPVATIRNIYQSGKPKEHIVGTFSADTDRNIGYRMNEFKDRIVIGKNKHKSHKVIDSMGFHTPFRISPKLFQGIVLAPYFSEVVDIYIKAMSESCNNKPEVLLPVYDLYGNLLWPRQMSYEEVKQFVAERDAKKAQSSSEQSKPEPQGEPPIQPEELDES